MKNKPYFRLKEPKSKKVTSIQMVLHFDKERLVYGVKESINPVLWDSDTKMPIQSKTTLSAILKKNKDLKKIDPFVIDATLPNLMSRLERIKLRVRAIHSNLKTQNIPIDKKTIKEALDNDTLAPNGIWSNKAKSKSALKRKEANEDHIFKNRSPYVSDAIKEFIELIDNGIITVDSKDERSYAKSTVKNYRGFAAQFTAFETKQKRKFKFEDITIQFRTTFKNYFIDKKYSKNTIGRHIKHLKVVMNKAHEDKLHDNPDYKEFDLLEVRRKNVYLTMDEIWHLYDFDLKERPRLVKYRDLFIIGCLTAMRYSDYSRIEKSNIKDLIDPQDRRRKIKVIDMMTQKTNTRVVIPVHKELVKILEKYNYTLPVVHEQKLNKAIKEIAELAKMNQIVDVTDVTADERTYNKVEKWTQITSHTGRRSGATNMYKNGIDGISIMKITGHKTWENFEKYISVSEEEVAILISKNKFFKGRKPALKAV